MTPRRSRRRSRRRLAMETYYVEHKSYAGATVGELESLQPALRDAPSLACPSGDVEPVRAQHVVDLHELGHLHGRPLAQRNDRTHLRPREHGRLQGRRHLVGTCEAHGGRAGIAFLGACGAAIGSFVNVLAYRLPRRESIVKPRSRCPSCGTQIARYDNIPVVSWLVLRGHCRHCHASISVRYPLVEALTALLFVRRRAEVRPRGHAPAGAGVDDHAGRGGRDRPRASHHPQPSDGRLGDRSPWSCGRSWIRAGCPRT